MHICMIQTALSSGGRNEYEVEQLRSGSASNFSGVSVANAIVKFGKSRRFSLLIIDNTNQTVTLKWVWLVAKPY